jgi:hypothetical protein
MDALRGVHSFFERKPRNGLTFYTPGGEITAYGCFDVSLDAATKGLGAIVGPEGAAPVGRVGWLPTSRRIFLYRCEEYQKLGDLPFNLVYPL